MYHYGGLGQRQLLGSNPVKYVDPDGRLYYSNDGPASADVQWFDTKEKFSNLIFGKAKTSYNGVIVK